MQWKKKTQRVQQYNKFAYPSTSKEETQQRKIDSYIKSDSTAQFYAVSIFFVA